MKHVINFHMIFLLLLSLLVATCVVATCGSREAPEQILNNFLEKANAKKYNEAKSYCIENVKFFLWPLGEKEINDITHNGTIKSVTILNKGEVVSSSFGSPAPGSYMIQFKIIYNNDKYARFSCELLSSNNTWRIMKIAPLIELNLP